MDTEYELTHGADDTWVQGVFGALREQLEEQRPTVTPADRVCILWRIPNAETYRAVLPEVGQYVTARIAAVEVAPDAARQGGVVALVALEVSERWYRNELRTRESHQDAP